MTERQERLIDALLVMGTVVVAFVLIGYLGPSSSSSATSS